MDTTIKTLILLALAGLLGGCVTTTDPATGVTTRKIDAEKVAEVANTAAQAVDEYVPGAIGDLIAGALGLFGAGAGLYARRKSKQAATALEVAAVKDNGLKATIAAIELFKKQGTPAQAAAIEQLIPFLATFQDAAGKQVRQEVRAARNAVTEGEESKIAMNN